MALTTQLLAQFNNCNYAIIINSIEFLLSNNKLVSLDRKDSKLGFIVLIDINQLLYYTNNFYFNIAFFAKESSYLNIQQLNAHNILLSSCNMLLTLCTIVPNLAAKILYYLHNQIQAYLQSYTKVSSFNKIKLYYLNQNNDLTNLI